jgi:hypothetical protein
MTITMERRLLYIPVLHIDTNLINTRQNLGAVNQLEKWFDGNIGRVRTHCCRSSNDLVTAEGARWSIWCDYEIVVIPARFGLTASWFVGGSWCI